MNFYQQILDLRYSTIDKSKKGYLFESIIRDIQPWDNKPPIFMSTRTEQLDGVFEYRSKIFIIESKAKDKRITPGSSDWEDYELKIRKRKGKGVIGLFCSLNEVTKGVIDEADALNREGFPNIVLHGDIWDQLHRQDIEFKNLIDYMILNSRINFKSTVKDLRKVAKWYNDKKFISETFFEICEKQSSIFIRRFKHNLHDKVYVERKISKSLDAGINVFRPNLLKKTKNEFVEQLILLRDVSGSGKTTLSIEKLISTSSCFSFGTTANQSEIDSFFDSFLDKINFPNFGLKQLQAVNKPFVYIIDSLDEVLIQNHYKKRREIKSLLKKVEILNNYAVQKGLVKFPIVILFTLREDFWRDWDSSFDGRSALHLTNRLNKFSEDEFNVALKNYSKAYEFRIENKLNKQSIEVLSLPVNLEIFSEANNYAGNIKVQDVWEGEMLAKYFETKYEYIIEKHYIDSFTKDLFIDILCSISNMIVYNKNLVCDKEDVIQIICDKYPKLKSIINEIIRLLQSEDIFTNNDDSKDSLRFKYTRFVEYLISLHIINRVKETKELKILDNFIQEIFDSHIIDTHTVLKNIRSICRKNYKTIGSKITKYYQTSEVYLKKFLPKLRGDIARGYKTDSKDIKHIISRSYTQNPEINWNMFFVVSAKKNNISKSKIKSSFKIAWEDNSSVENRIKRWKLLDKLSKLGMLVDEVVLNILLKDSLPKDWEVFLGKILESPSNTRDHFYELWEQIGGNNIINKLLKENVKEWRYISKLLEVVLMNKKYVLGDFFNESLEESEYVTFERKKYINIDEEKKVKFDNYIDILIKSLKDKSIIYRIRSSYGYQFSHHNLSLEEYDYLSEEFEEKIVAPFGLDNKPFFCELISSYDEYLHFISSILSNKLIKKKHYYNQDNKLTILRELANSNIDQHYELYNILDYIYSQGYNQNEYDDNFFHIAPRVYSDNYYITRCYYSLNDLTLAKQIREIDRVIFILLSMMNKTVIGFRYPGLIGVGNHALDYCKEYSDLLTRAMHTYDMFDELMKRKSFNRKYENLIKVKQNNKYDTLLKRLFPEVFW